MPPPDAAPGEQAPRKAIRRFDVFAEYTRLERRDKGVPEDEAKGYGVWLAKVVAARRFGGGAATGTARAKEHADAEGEEPRFRSVGDEVQTDATFDREIVERMGAGFYEAVFAPAIAEARAGGASYEAIRDTIRAGWKPAKAASR